MKNLSILLDDKTIINFAFFFKLLKRYYLIPTLSPILVLVIGSYIYKSQNDVFSISTGLKVISTDSRNESSSSLNNLLGADKKMLSYGEVISLGKSLDFNLKLAEKLYSHSKFEMLNLNKLKAKTLLSQAEIFQDCAGAKDCTIKKLATIIAEMYSITPDQVIDNKYQIMVKSLNGATSRVILNLLVEQLQQKRESDLRVEMTHKIKVTKDLLKKKKDELDKENYFGLEEMLRQKDKELAELESSISSINRVLINQKLKLNKVKLTVRETDNAISRSINSEDQAKFEKYSDLKEKIAKLRDDLHVLEMSSKQGSAQDKVIISQLKGEIAKKNAELKSLGKVKRVYSNVEKFVAKKDQDSDFDKFDFNVLIGELAATEKELADLHLKKDKLQEERSFFEIKYGSLKPSFEYLKILEEKIVQLELLKWTIVLDIQFDENFGSVKRFKRTTLAKLGIFSAMITIFMIFIGIVVRYIFDKRVYDEYEISQNFKGLDIIGNTPEFD